MGIMSALISLVSKWRRFWFLTNSKEIKKWYVWLSGSAAGVIIAKNKVEKISTIKDAKSNVKDLSNRIEFINLFISKFGFRNLPFLNLKKEKLKIKFKNEKINKFCPFIALKKDKISIFKTIKAKYAIKIIKKLPHKDAIK